MKDSSVLVTVDLFYSGAIISPSLLVPAISGRQTALPGPQNVYKSSRYVMMSGAETSQPKSMIYMIPNSTNNQ